MASPPQCRNARSHGAIDSCLASSSWNWLLNCVDISVRSVSVALPAEPRGEKKLFFVQILGGEKLLKFGEKWAVKNF